MRFELNPVANSKSFACVNVCMHVCIFLSELFWFFFLIFLVLGTWFYSHIISASNWAFSPGTPELVFPTLMMNLPLYPTRLEPWIWQLVTQDFGFAALTYRVIILVLLRRSNLWISWCFKVHSYSSLTNAPSHCPDYKNSKFHLPKRNMIYALVFSLE